MSMCQLCNRFVISDDKHHLCQICQLRCSTTSSVFDQRAKSYAHFLGWFMPYPGSFAFVNTNFIIYPTTRGVYGRETTVCLNGLGIPVSWVDSGRPLVQYGIY